MLSLLRQASKLRSQAKSSSRSPRTQLQNSRPTLAFRARCKHINKTWTRCYNTKASDVKENLIKSVGAKGFIPKPHAPRPGQQSSSTTPTSSYSSDKVHLLPETPHLWAGGALPRHQFIVFLNDLLSQGNWTSAARLYAQLVYQTHYDKAVAMEQSIRGILIDELPKSPLPTLSEVELLGVFESLRNSGLNRHALDIWKYFDTEDLNGKPLLKPHVHYYSQAFETPYTLFSDVRNAQLLVSVLEVADQVQDKALVDSIFVRLTAGLVDNIKLAMVSKSEIPRTPLWHVSYRRQLHVLELGLKNLDVKTQGSRIIEYITTYRLKFATCWTPLFLTRLYSLLDSVKTHDPSMAESADALTESIKALAFKIGSHKTLQAIWDDPCRKRILASQPLVQFDSTSTLRLDTVSAAYLHPPSSGTAAPGSAQPHPGLTNIIAHIAELDNHPSKENYQIIKQLYLECMEPPYYFQETASIVEPALKHFIAGDDEQSVTWLYQMCLERQIGLSPNAWNALMFWSLRKRKDSAQCMEFFNDLQVALGPQSANAATILLLFEAIQSRKDLDAAVNALDYVIEHITSWTILKQGMETTLNLAFEKQDLARIKLLSDLMAVYLPRAYNDRWRPRIAEYLAAIGEKWIPPTAIVSERGAFL